MSHIPITTLLKMLREGTAFTVKAVGDNCSLSASRQQVPVCIKSIGLALPQAAHATTSHLAMPVSVTCTMSMRASPKIQGSQETHMYHSTLADTN